MAVATKDREHRCIAKRQPPSRRVDVGCRLSYHSWAEKCMHEATIGVDVGTGSARAGIFTLDGAMLGSASHVIRAWHPQPDFVQQSTDDIWSAVCASVRDALRAVGPVVVRGIGFDATCSLVVVDADGQPVSVSPDNDPEQDVSEQNVIVWMDHRAFAQAERINRTHHAVLRYVGGRVSLEMETPKLL